MKLFQHTTSTTASKEIAMRMRRERRGVGSGRGARGIAAVAAMAAGLLAPAAASAGEYTVSYCLGPGNTQQNAWSGVGSPQPWVSCVAGTGFPGSGVYYNSATLPENGYGGLRSIAPPGARFKRMTIDLKVPYQALSRRTYIEANSAYVFNVFNTGGASSYNPDGHFFNVDLNDSAYFEVGQACHGTGGRGCEAGDFYFTGISATLEDKTAPNVSADAVGVFDSGRSFFSGMTSARVDVTDSGHGPASTHMVVDGQEHAGSRRSWAGECNYRLTSPCAARFDHVHDLDTRRYSDGIHTVRVVGDDGMGLAAYAERTVTFDNTAPSVDGVSPINGQTHSGESHTFAVSASDATAGVERIEWRLGAGAWQAVSDGRVTVNGSGTHTVEVRAVDRAGNVSPVATSTFTLAAPPSGQDVTTGDGGALPGAPGPGDVIRCDVGDGWTEGTTFEYQWLRDGVAIPGAVDSTYTVKAEDAGESISCRVIARNPAGSVQRETPPVVVGSERCFGQTGPTQPCGDFDGDGSDNATDPDDDNDGVADGSDSAPFDPNVPGSGGGGSGATPSGTTPTSGSGSSGSGSGSSGAGSGAAASREPYVGPPNNGVNASNKARITVQGTRRRTVRFGRRIATVAHLRDEHGRPITGATVTVLERTNVPGAAWRPARDPLVSDSRGRLRWVIPAKESRTIRYAYKANLGNTEFQSTSDVVLTVFSRSTMKVNRRVLRNGQAVTFGGRLLSRPVPRGGVLIDLQAKVGKRWQTFRTVRTKLSGAWKAAYRFRATTGVRTYTFRARVRQDSAYPYAISTTRTVKVKVIG